MKMRRIRYIQLGLLLAAALVVSTCLPSFISRIWEKRLLDKEEVEAAEIVSVSRTERMEKKEPMEKFLFLLQPEVEYMEYTATGGTGWDADQAREQLAMEMQYLWEMGLMSADGEDAKTFHKGLSIQAEGVYTAANTKNPAQSLVVWQYIVQGLCGEWYEVTMDDASGKVIGLRILAASGTTLPGLLDADYETFAYMWGEYLGMSRMEVTDISYQKVNREEQERQWKAAVRNFGTVPFEIGSPYGWIVEQPEQYNAGVTVDLSDQSVGSIVQDLPDDSETDAQRGIVFAVNYYYGEKETGSVLLNWNAYTCGFSLDTGEKS